MPQLQTASSRHAAAANSRLTSCSRRQHASSCRSCRQQVSHHAAALLASRSPHSPLPFVRGHARPQQRARCCSDVSDVSEHVDAPSSSSSEPSIVRSGPPGPARGERPPANSQPAANRVNSRPAASSQPVVNNNPGEQPTWVLYQPTCGEQPTGEWPTWGEKSPVLGQ
jgi:hypothetical protein